MIYNQARLVRSKLDELALSMKISLEPDSYYYKGEADARIKELFSLLRKVPKLSFLPKGYKGEFIYLKNMVDGVFSGFTEHPFKKLYLRDCLEDLQCFIEALRDEWFDFEKKVDEEIAKMRKEEKEAKGKKDAKLSKEEKKLSWQDHLKKIKNKLEEHEKKLIKQREEKNDVDNIDWKLEENILKEFLNEKSQPLLHSDTGIVRTPVLLSLYVPRFIADKLQDKQYDVHCLFKQYTLINNMTVFSVPDTAVKNKSESDIIRKIQEQIEGTDLILWSRHVVRFNSNSYYLLVPKYIVLRYRYLVGHWILNSEKTMMPRPNPADLYTALDF